MKSRNFAVLLVSVLALLISVFPVGAQPPKGFPVTVVDGAGRKLIFEAAPQRIVSLYNGNYGNLATLGIRPVGVLANPSMIADSRFFADGKSIPSVATAELSVDAEAVAAAKPDLILTSNADEVATLEKIAPVYVALNTNTLDGLYAETRQLGVILGVTDRAEAAIKAFQDRLAAYQALTERNVSVILAGSVADDLNAIRVRTRVSPDCQLMNLIAICEWPDPTGGARWSYETTPETLLNLNPDYIYYWDVWDGTMDELLAYVRENTLWAATDAVQNGRLLHVSGYSNPIASSLVSATQILDTFAPLLYPEVFPDGALTTEQVEQTLADGTATPDATLAATSAAE